MSDEDLIGLGTNFEMDTLRELRKMSVPEESLDYLADRYDTLVLDIGGILVCDLLARHANMIGY